MGVTSNTVTLYVRRLLVALLIMVGAYYAYAGAAVILNLTEVAQRWVYRSGDSDFPADVAQFRRLIGIGAALWLTLGIWTVVCGVRTLTGRFVRGLHWIGLAVTAVLIHAPWLLYRRIDAGRLSRAETWLQVRAALIQWAIVALLYVCTAIVMHYWPLRRQRRPLRLA